MQDHSIGGQSRMMLLEQKKIQDAITAVIQYIPSVLYVVTSLVYGPLMFVVQESRLRSVLLAFTLQLAIIGALSTLRILLAHRTQRFYEMVALRRPSDPDYTSDMIWADRLAELRHYTRYEQRSSMFGAIELALWFAFAVGVYYLARQAM